MMVETELSILVVDDDPMIVQSIFEMLNDEIKAYTFLQANSGRIAFNVALTKLPRLIITDWDMPDLNGIELIRQLKANPLTADIPVIMATGVMVTSEHLRHALEVGAIDFLRKPIDQIELKARVNAMLTLSNHIEEIKLMNETIQDSNVFLQYLINIIPNPIVHYDITGTILVFNQSFRWAFDTDKDNFQSFYNYFLKDGVEIHLTNDRRIIGGLIPIAKYESHITYADETKHDALFTKVPVKNKSGDVKGILCVINDVTEMKKQHADDIQKHKSELAGISMRLIQSSELNEKIMRDIEKLVEMGNESNRDLLEGLATSYKTAVNDNIWVEFEKRFNDVHVDFYHSLSMAHPDLTGNERKLCAFLKLDMSSKEIATITFQNAKSIDMARYRLRKKLGLEGEDSLQGYLMKF